jgi:hypothetical protein
MMASNLTSLGFANALRDAKPFDTIVCISLLCFLLYRAQRFFRPASTSLPGPPSDSYFFGVSKLLSNAVDPAVLYEQWAKEYGPVFRVPLALGSSRVVLCDPKAIAYFYSRETTGFVMRKLGKVLVERLVCT